MACEKAVSSRRLSKEWPPSTPRTTQYKTLLRVSWGFHRRTFVKYCSSSLPRLWQTGWLALCTTKSKTYGEFRREPITPLTRANEISRHKKTAFLPQMCSKSAVTDMQPAWKHTQNQKSFYLFQIFSPRKELSCRGILQLTTLFSQRKTTLFCSTTSHSDAIQGPWKQFYRSPIQQWSAIYSRAVML